MGFWGSAAKFGAFGVPGLILDRMGSKDELGPSGYNQAPFDAIKKRMAGLQQDLNQVGAPKMLGAEGPTYQARQNLPQFNAIRNRVSNQANAAGQTAQDALARRYAAMGAGNSGAFIKQQQQLLQDTEDRKQDALAQVDDQEKQALESEYNKEFQSAEAAKGRDLQRQQYNSDIDFRDKVFRFDSKSKLAQLEMAFTQAERDAQDQQFNKEMERYQARHSGGLLGAGGILGTGIGA